MAKPVLAAGGVVFRRASPLEDPEFLLIRRPRYKDWTLPKGKIDRGEAPAEAALREVREETGYHCNPILEVGSIGYALSSGRRKAVRYWLMKAESGGFKPNNEVDKITWLDFDKAQQKLTFRKDHDVISWAAELTADPERGRVHLVRHGSAGTPKQGDPKDRDRRLSGTGKRHAAKIGRRLSRIPVERIISSPYIRCRQTLEPLDDMLSIGIEEDKRLAEGTKPKDTMALISELRGQAAVLCTHGGIIGDLLGYLAADSVPLEGDLSWEKSSTWTLETRKGRVLSGAYRQPPK